MDIGGQRMQNFKGMLANRIEILLSLFKGIGEDCKIYNSFAYIFLYFPDEFNIKIKSR